MTIQSKTKPLKELRGKISDHPYSTMLSSQIAADKQVRAEFEGACLEDILPILDRLDREIEEYRAALEFYGYGWNEIMCNEEFQGKVQPFGARARAVLAKYPHPTEEG